MTAAEMARIHALAFPGKGWAEADFAAYGTDPTVLITTDGPAFAVLRVAADEAEILTLATDPAAQGRGHGHRALATGLAAAAAAGARTVHLEVAETNAAARALYARAGFAETGRRPRYYGPTDALLLSRCLP